MTGRKETFTPLKAGDVRLYVCGITPYDDVHLGHARCYVVFDLLKRVLERRGLNVRHIQNFTDIDDKIIDRAKKTNADPLAFPEPYIQNYFDMMSRLNVKPADRYPRVTQSIPSIMRLIDRLMRAKMAYAAKGSVFFSVRAFPAYGQLSKRKIDELESGARVEVDPDKKDPLDFVLWKAAKAGEPSWSSPWGLGRPGWHIECSAMAIEHLGEEFDIHGGGQDLIFPHHENEIAQAVGATGKRFAKLWMHNGFVTINEEKMSKSLGNFFALKDVFAKVDPVVVRYFLLSQHYRSPLNYSDQELDAAKAAWSDRVCGAYRIALDREKNQAVARPVEGRLRKEIDDIAAEFEKSLSDDLNTSGALGALNKMCTVIYEMDKVTPVANEVDWKGLSNEMLSMMEALGLKAPVEEEWPSELLAMVSEREKARKERNWAKSDEIRDRLKAKGFLVEDSSSGPRLKRI
jgi:cysteinyl-tRNA synthetase